MTIPEIQALKRELEDAMLQAFSDFERISGVAIVAVAVERIESWPIGQRKPDSRITFVNVQLENL